jgi:branched-chain amino acid transport system permease protein
MTLEQTAVEQAMHDEVGQVNPRDPQPVSRRLPGLVRAVQCLTILVALIVLTWVSTSVVNIAFYTTQIEGLLLSLILVLGLQVYSGNSGVLSFGHVAYMAVGGYTSALTTIPSGIKRSTFLSMPKWLGAWLLDMQLGTWGGIAAGTGCAGIVAAVLGVALVRLPATAATIASVAVLVISNVLITQTPSITLGANTVIGVPTTTTVLSTALWAAAICVLAWLYKSSRRGLQLCASRENDDAARSVGVRPAIERYVAYVISGAMFGLGGALYVHYYLGFSSSDFYFAQTFILIAMLVVDGMSSVSGAVVGTYFVSIILIVFRQLEASGIGGARLPSGTSQLAVAVALLAALLLRPRGLTGGREIQIRLRPALTRTRRRPASSEVS